MPEAYPLHEFLRGTLVGWSDQKDTDTPCCTLMPPAEVTVTGVGLIARLPTLSLAARPEDGLRCR